MSVSEHAQRSFIMPTGSKTATYTNKKLSYGRGTARCLYPTRMRDGQTIALNCAAACYWLVGGASQAAMGNKPKHLR